MSLVKSKQRVADHGEVFTPPGLVTDMIDLVADEASRIDSRFLEPACGSGNFLIPVLQRKFATVQARYGGSEFERSHHALLALMSIYGIELLPDNVAECRDNLLRVFVGFIAQGAAHGPASDSDITADDNLTRAARAVLALNIVHGDALSMRTVATETRSDEPIIFAEWAYLGKGRFHRRDFRFDTMTQAATFGEDDTLFADLGKHEIFMPVSDYGALTVGELAALADEATGE